MGAAFFYHLTRSSLDEALSLLIDRSLGNGWRVAVRGTEAGRLEWLDQKLWMGPEEQFLPHGMAGGAHDALQPVLLTTGAERPNDAACLMAIDRADVAPDEVNMLDRVCIVFDGYDHDQLTHARGQWKSLTEAGCSAQYWSEESGRWEKKAEK